MTKCKCPLGYPQTRFRERVVALRVHTGECALCDERTGPPSRRRGRSVVTSVRFKPTELQALQWLAEDLGWTVTDVIRASLKL
ncbi:hypothetical protein LCGC14_1600340 [marine sediment metagenome]|uniref:Uncharacterized protein n=1 Tax=marine sediment metagenome TaxID=412755 RepID=A0A0F9IBM8_9ZZZZ